MNDTRFKAGDIVAGTWGYGMTIPVFAVITRRTDKTVWFKKIAKNRVFYFGDETPVLPIELATAHVGTPGAVEHRAKIREYFDSGFAHEGGEYFKFEFAHMRAWNGNPIYANYMD